MAAVYNKYLEDAKKYYADARAKSKEAQNKIYDEQEIVANDTYNAKINEAKASYDELQRENAIQKLINENEVAEDMANMGLSNSGLNRTQQTAVQLSYANNKSSIDRQRQLEVDSYARSLAAEISAIKQNRIASEAQIDAEYDQLAESAAQSAYKTATSGSSGSGGSGATTNIINHNGGVLAHPNGSLSSKNVTVTYNTDEYGERTTTTYFDNVTGKKTTVAATVNPYTLKNNAVADGTNNNLVAAGKAYGYYDNGYQPRGIDGKTKLTLADSKAFTINGNTQNVFKGGSKYYVWDGVNNEYFEVKKVSSGNGTYKWEQVT